MRENGGSGGWTGEGKFKKNFFNRENGCVTYEKMMNNEFANHEEPL